MRCLPQKNTIMQNSRKRHKVYDEECRLNNLPRNRADYYDVKLIKMNENENKLFRQTEAERKREAYQQKKNGTRKPSITELVIVTMVREYYFSRLISY